ILRILVEPGAAPMPSSLRVSLEGVSAAPRTIAPVTLPGTIVVHHLPSNLGALCVEIDGLDDGGNVIAGSAATVHLIAHGTAEVTLTLDESGAACAPLPGDLGGPVDLAGASGDLGGGGATDMSIAICPAGAIFCDDFESGTLGKWDGASAKKDAGSLTVQSSIKAHGMFALRAIGNGSASPGDVYAEVEKDFTPTAPPFALRANVYFPATLAHFDEILALYENPSGSTNAFTIGGDSSGFWVVAENESMAGDFESDMVPTDGGKWHCVELVIDAAGMVDFYVDNHHLVGPWQRTSAVSYSTLFVGVTRSVDADLTAYIDDVAIGPSRLYCPQ
ncbi:MAG TPA: hypothetical protein VGL86_12970, partial [Polyangia bacterium]